MANPILPKRQLDVAARPVDKMVSPFVQAPSNNLKQLGQFLSAASPAMRDLMAKNEAKEKKQAEAAAAKRIGGMSYEEAAKLRSEGKLAEQDDEWYRAALEQSYGARTAEHTANRIQDTISNNQIDFSAMNDEQVDSWFAGQTRSDLETLGDSTVGINAYTRAIEKVRGKLLQVASKERTDAMRSDALQAQALSYQDAISLADEAGLNPEEAAKVFLGAEARGSALYRLDEKQQASAKLSVLDMLASSGRADLVDAIVQSGDNPLSKDPAYASKISSIVSKASKANMEMAKKDNMDNRIGFRQTAANGSMNEEEFRAYNEANPGVFSQAEQESMIISNRAKYQDAVAVTQNAQAFHQQGVRQDNWLSQVIETGSGHRLADQELLGENGKSVKWTVKQQKEAMVDKIVNTDLGDPQANMIYRADTLVRNGLTNPAWEAALTNGVNATSIIAAGEGKIAPATSEGYQLYQNLRATNPQALSTHISKEDEAYYRAIDTEVRLAGVPVEQAIMNVSTWQSKLNTPEGRQMYNTNMRELQERVDDVTSNWFGSDDTLAGSGVELNNLASMYIKRGMRPADALDAAEDTLERTTIVVNGVRMRNSTQRPGFAEAVSYFQEKAAGPNGNPSNFTVEPINEAQGLYSVRRLTDMSIVQIDNKSIFTIDDLMTPEDAAAQASISEAAAKSAEETARKLAEQQEFLDEMAENAERLPKHVLQGTNKFGNTPTYNPSTINRIDWRRSN